MELEMTPKQISNAAEDQVEFAILAAKVILFIVDVRSGITALDEIVSENYAVMGSQSFLSPIRWIARKMKFCHKIFSFRARACFDISAEHGRGIGVLRGALSEALGPKPEAETGIKEKRIQISLVGRPNVGKSSIGNALIESKRLIVSDVPGTTRDAVELDLNYKHKDRELLKFRLTDTAGLRMKRKVDSSVEYFSGVRTQHSIERSDVVSGHRCNGWCDQTRSIFGRYDS